jgi:hypothetical protein
MNVGTPFVTHAQTPVLRESGEGALDHPAVPPESLSRLDADARDAMLDAPHGACTTTACEVVPFVGVYLRGPSSWAAALPVADRRDRIEHRVEQLRVVEVRRAGAHRQRHGRRIDDQMVLDAGLAAVRRGRAELLAPLFAGRARASTQVRP